MDKFAREKAKRMDTVKERGVYPFSYTIKKGDEYLPEGVTIQEFKHVANQTHITKKETAQSMSPKSQQTITADFDALLPDAKKLFFQIFLFHPETIIELPRVSEIDGSTEITFISYNRVFFWDLVRALIKRQSKVQLNIGRQARTTVQKNKKTSGS